MRVTALFASIFAISSLEIVLAPAEARAQSNYRLSPVGGRSQLLGGTGMAYGRDATAAFLNPGTAVLVDDNRLSFSVNFYALSLSKSPRWFRPGGIDQSKFGSLAVDDPALSNLEFDALPSSLCIFLRAGQIGFLSVAAKKDPRTRDAKVGFCFAQIYNQASSFSAENFNAEHSPFVTRQAQTMSQKFVRFAAGPTYSMYVSNAFTIGASLHLGLVTHRNLMQASATTFGTGASTISSSFYNSSRGTAFNVGATLGATMRFGKQTVGLSVKTPSAHIFGSGGFNQQSAYDVGAGTSSDLVTAQGSFVVREPIRVGLGTGIEGSWGLFEFNTMISTPMGEAYSAELEGTQSTKSASGTSTDQPVALNLSQPARGVVNFAAGMEVFMSEKVSTLIGLSSDFSAVQSGNLINRQGYFNYYPARTSRVAGSFGFSSRGTGGELMIGGELSVGWGDRIAINSYQLPPVFGTTGEGVYQFMLVIAGSTSFRNIKRAVDDVKKTINDPSPLKPATKPNVQEPLINNSPNDKPLDKTPDQTAKEKDDKIDKSPNTVSPVAPGPVFNPRAPAPKK